MTVEGLHGFSCTDIPKLGKGIAGAGDKDVLVGWVDADRHDIAQVISEFGHFRARFDIPQHAGHVTGGGNNSAVVDEATAGEVARMTGELTRNTCWAFAGRQVVDGADVIQTTAGDVVSTWGVGACHHPGRPQRNGVDLVSGIGIPNDELPILRS